MGFVPVAMPYVDMQVRSTLNIFIECPNLSASANTYCFNVALL